MISIPHDITDEYLIVVILQVSLFIVNETEID